MQLRLSCRSGIPDRRRAFSQRLTRLSGGAGVSVCVRDADLPRRARPKASMRPHTPGCRAARAGRSAREAPGSTIRCCPSESRPSIARTNSSGAPVAQACGLQAVGYSTGILVPRAGSRRTPRAAGRRTARRPPASPAAMRAGLGAVAVAPQAPGDDRVVVRPHRADVVADRIVRALARGHRPHAPAREQRRRPSGARTHALGLVLVGDAAPQQVPDVRGERVDLALLPSSASAKKLALRHPEVLVEARLELRGLALQLLGPARDRSRPRAPGAPSAAWRRRRSPAARRSRAASAPASRRRRRSSPTSPSSTGCRGRSPRCAARTRRSRRRRDRRSDRSSRCAARASRSSVARQRRVARPALVLLEQDQEERRGVGGAVVGRVRPLLEGGHLAEAQLVQDLAGLLVAEGVVASAPGTAPASAASSPPARARTAAPGSW